MGKFVEKQTLNWESLDWGTLAKVSSPLVCNAKDLVVLDVVLYPGKGHNFHKHPQQEEVIYVLEGQVEQWIGKDKKILGPGDSAFIKADEVHASFNISDKNARLLAILGPSIGEDGYEVVEIGDNK